MGFNHRRCRWSGLYLATLATCGLVFVSALAAQVPKDAAAKKEAKPRGRKAVPLFAGKTLTRWKIVDIHGFQRHGKVEIKEGAALLNQGSPMTGVAYTGKPPRINYELSLEARRVEGDDFFCGLTFPVGKRYCTLILGGWGGDVVGLSNVDGVAASENETTTFQSFEKGRWYRLRLRVTKDKIQAWIDKQQVIDLKTKERKFSIWWEQEPMRPLGISTWHTTGAIRKILLKSW